MLPSLTASGPKSHLGGFAQVLSQHYEVDQRLRVAAVLKGGREKDRDGKRESHSSQSKNRTALETQSGDKTVKGNSTLYLASFMSLTEMNN